METGETGRDEPGGQSWYYLKTEGVEVKATLCNKLSWSSTHRSKLGFVAKLTGHDSGSLIVIESQNSQCFLPSNQISLEVKVQSRIQTVHLKCHIFQTIS